MCWLDYNSVSVGHTRVIMHIILTPHYWWQCNSHLTQFTANWLDLVLVLTKSNCDISYVARMEHCCINFIVSLSTFGGIITSLHAPERLFFRISVRLNSYIWCVNSFLFETRYLILAQSVLNSVTLGNA